MRAISRGVHRLEVQLRPAVAERRLTIQYGNLKTLLADTAWVGTVGCGRPK